jgi:hypothetical protein
MVWFAVRTPVRGLIGCGARGWGIDQSIRFTTYTVVTAISRWIAKKAEFALGLRADLHAGPRLVHFLQPDYSA